MPQDYNFESQHQLNREEFDDISVLALEPVRFLQILDRENNVRNGMTRGMLLKAQSHACREVHKQLQKYFDYDLLYIVKGFSLIPMMSSFDLQEILARKGLRNIEHRNDIVDSIMINFSEKEFSKETKNFEIYSLTEKGKLLVEEYKNYIENH